jgi:hypothetical protein
MLINYILLLSMKLTTRFHLIKFIFYNKSIYDVYKYLPVENQEIQSL